jgi:hypothetical protein
MEDRQKLMPCFNTAWTANAGQGAGVEANPIMILHKPFICVVWRQPKEEAQDASAQHSKCMLNCKKSGGVWLETQTLPRIFIGV